MALWAFIYDDRLAFAPASFRRLRNAMSTNRQEDRGFNRPAVAGVAVLCAATVLISCREPAHWEPPAHSSPRFESYITDGLQWPEADSRDFVVLLSLTVSGDIAPKDLWVKCGDVVVRPAIWSRDTLEGRWNTKMLVNVGRETRVLAFTVGAGSDAASGVVEPVDRVPEPGEYPVASLYITRSSSGLVVHHNVGFL